jgi:hypothetical protein
MKVAHPTPRLAHVFDGFGMLDEALYCATDPHGPSAGIGIECIGVPAKHFADVVVEQTMNQNHVSASQLLPAGHPLPD